MKLPWYIKDKGITSKDGKLYFNISFNKWWVRIQQMKIFFLILWKGGK
jgi:hypothetical protein